MEPVPGHTPVQPDRISIVIPLYNQLAYTRICLESLRATVPAETGIILIDNASSDGTSGYLSTLAGVSVISNQENLGFAGACNQGIRAATGEWIVVMNNDVILSAGWLAGLLEATGRWELDMVSPAIREGENNYDIENHAHELTGRMRGVIRRGKANGICFMAHRRVFDTIGLFDENFRIGQYEDKDLFLRAVLAGFRLGTVGSAFLHHFGSVTQNSIKSARVVKPYALENKAYFIRKWKLPWWKRAIRRTRDRVENNLCSLRERLLYGHTLMEKWIDGRVHYE
ncbi:MAG: glycosyltransferase family 2 protein [Desulfuromonadales bacterium]